MSGQLSKEKIESGDFFEKIRWQECKRDLAMPAEYFRDTLRSQLCSLSEEDALKDTTITLRESISKEISLDDVDAERLLKLLGLASGKEGLVAEGIEDLLGLGELAERLQMTAVRIEVEDELFKELRVENCLQMIQRSEASGLKLLQKQCHKMLCDNFAVISQEQGFPEVSEETMGALLEEDELQAGREEIVFVAVVRWMSNSDERMRFRVLLRKIRYGVMSNEYLAWLTASESMPWHGMVKELVGEAMAKKGNADCERMWDGVERLCDKSMVARGMRGRIIGADVLKCPRYVAMDGQGRIVISDSGPHEIIVFNHDGSIARRLGSRGVAAGQFNIPQGVAVDWQGHIVVAEYGNHRIQVLNADGSVARCFGSEGSAVGQLKRPCGVAIDREGHIVVADLWNHRIQVFDGDGSIVRHFGSRGADVGELIGPTGVAVDGEGRIVVADWGNHRVQVFNDDGSVALCFGSEGDGPGQLRWPRGVAVDGEGRFVVSDTSNNRVQVFNSDGSVASVLGSLGEGMGELSQPYGVMVDGAGRLLVTEGGNNNRMQVL